MALRGHDDGKFCLEGGFPIEIKTKIRYLMLLSYFQKIKYLILVLTSIGNPPINDEIQAVTNI